jgi:hypothetical protein
MNRQLHTIACLGFVLGSSTFSLAQTPSGPPTEPQPFVAVPGEMEFTGRMIARPLQAEDAARYGLAMDAIAAHARAASQALARFPLVRYEPRTDETLFQVPEGSETAVAHELMAGGDFQYVEPDWRVWPVGCPNDTLFGNQWHHVVTKMNSCAGWDIETGDPSVVVAVCDTGVRTDHTDLLLHRKEGYNSVNHLWESQGGQINDINGHGTMTTGCAAANGNNGKGVTGTGWDLSHRMMRVSNTSDGSSSIAALVDAVETAADVGDRVASVSYSGVTSGSVQTAGAYIRARNGLLVWAAGNDGGNLSGNRDDQVIVVGSTGHSDVRSSFSNYGTFVDLFAPGEDIYSTTRNSTASYGAASGTSFACPLTAGLVGLIFSADPSLTPAQAEDILRAGCDDLGASGEDNIYGFGRIDVQGSLLLIGPGCDIHSYCISTANSAGPGSFIANTGTGSISANNLGLYSYGNPTGQFGVFFMGPNEALQPFGNGYLCISGALTRYSLVQSDSFGIATYDVDNTVPPALGKLTAGSTWKWQYWYRDPMGGGAAFNLSDGLSILFCP